MAEKKIYIVILTIDLDCHCCSKKIRKTVCKLQECENIVSIVYDQQKNTVTLSGPFDPQRLSKKLYCKACKVIKGIEIKEKEKEKKKPDGEDTKKEKTGDTSKKDGKKGDGKDKETPKPQPVVIPVVCPSAPVCGWRPPCQGCQGGCGTCARPCGCSGGVPRCPDKKCCSPCQSCCEDNQCKLM